MVETDQFEFAKKHLHKQERTFFWDFTGSTNELGYNLAFLRTNTATQRGYTIATLISKHRDEKTMLHFFRTVVKQFAERGAKLVVHKVMIDNDDASRNAIQAMGWKDELCWFHATQDWERLMKSDKFLALRPQVRLSTANMHYAKTKEEVLKERALLSAALESERNGPELWAKLNNDGGRPGLLAEKQLPFWCISMMGLSSTSEDFQREQTNNKAEAAMRSVKITEGLEGKTNKLISTLVERIYYGVGAARRRRNCHQLSMKDTKKLRDEYTRRNEAAMKLTVAADGKVADDEHLAGRVSAGEKAAPSFEVVMKRDGFYSCPCKEYGRLICTHMHALLMSFGLGAVVRALGDVPGVGARRTHLTSDGQANDDVHSEDGDNVVDEATTALQPDAETLAYGASAGHPNVTEFEKMIDKAGRLCDMTADTKAKRQMETYIMNKAHQMKNSRKRKLDVLQSWRSSSSAAARATASSAVLKPNAPTGRPRADVLVPASEAEQQRRDKRLQAHVVTEENAAGRAAPVALQQKKAWTQPTGQGTNVLRNLRRNRRYDKKTQQNK